MTHELGTMSTLVPEARGDLPDGTSCTQGAASRGDTGYWSWFEHSPIRAADPCSWMRLRLADEKCRHAGSTR